MKLMKRLGKILDILFTDIPWLSHLDRPKSGKMAWVYSSKGWVWAWVDKD